MLCFRRSTIAFSAACLVLTSPPISFAQTPGFAPGSQPAKLPALEGLSALQKSMGTSSLEDTDLRFGMTGPFSGPSKELGRQIAQGIDVAFQAANETGGLAGRQLKLLRADDGYEPARTPELVKRLVEQDKVAGFIGSFGTANAAAVLPWLQERKVLFYAPFTGAPVVRANPPDANVFNFRPSYMEETEAAVRYLVTVRGIKPADIAVFAQDDGFGQAGYDGAARALRGLSAGRYEQPPLRLTYKRNTLDVADAIGTALRQKQAPKAFVMVALYRPAAKFIEGIRRVVPTAIFTNVSAVGSSALAEELALAGAKFANGVVVTQVVPAASGFSKIVMEYKAALTKYAPGEKADYLSLEGFIEAKLLIEAIRRAGTGPIDSAKLSSALESLTNYDGGLGTPISFSGSDHQAIHTVWGTMLDGAGDFKAIDLR